MVEDTQTCFMKLLVAKHVMIHQPILQNLQYVSLHEGTEMQTTGQTLPPSST
jgi:hypothetical protein